TTFSRAWSSDVCSSDLAGAAGFEGYYNNPEADAERVRNGWYWTGDLGYRDEDGFFYFAGRSSDWLRVDSENFAAAPVERILFRRSEERRVGKECHARCA